MGFVLRVAVALIGALLLRGYLYPRRWRRRSFSGALLAFVGALLLFPLANRGSTGLAAATVILTLALFPYRRIAVAYMTARTRAGLQRLADRWEVELKEDPETGQRQALASRDGRTCWAGSVLVREGSMDPAVHRRQIRYMMAFVIELPERPPFLCSLMRGWDRPRYFEREWRVTHVVKGELLSADFSQLGILNPTGRPTGGDLRELSALEDPPDELPSGISVLASDPEAFLRWFDRDLRKRFATVSVTSYPFELNITPSSVNIYTTYCGPVEQEANVALLEALVDRLGC